jgi:anti-sigma regulatory factor (Ser/Thr protein kinase)
MSSKVRVQGEKVRRFILDHVGGHPTDIASVASKKFDITRQGVNKHLQRLAQQGAIVRNGSARAPQYKLASIDERSFHYDITSGLAEDVVWTINIRPALSDLPDNVLNIWHHGFTEMFNNAIDHSGGTAITVVMKKTAVSTELMIRDNGVGIFKKIQGELELLDERHAIFELSKGKLTTDPRNHSGEGIFFTSRMFDKFDILSGGVFFNHDRDHREDWFVESTSPSTGTAVFLELHNHTARTTKKVFDEYSSGEDYGFTKTVVPVNLAKYGPDELVSRSQAKRVLARVELFKKVVFDFKNVGLIGQAFADQIFRVFANEHPTIELLAINTNKEIRDMIARAKTHSDNAG